MPRFGRVLLVVLDSVGIGGAPDAFAYGDQGADTLGHIRAAVGLALPELASLGLGRLTALDGPVPAPGAVRAAYGRMTERSAGKDTMTGHFELAGVVTERAYPTYTHTGFPADVIAAFNRVTGAAGVLGNVAASGTEILDRLGVEHARTGWPIVYTSGDSVFQVAAHEGVVPLATLHTWCARARTEVLVGAHAVARVIARPFAGPGPSRYERTKGRKDFALPPPAPTVLDRLHAAGRTVVGVGKIGDIFSMRGIARNTKGKSNDECVDDLLAEMARPGADLIFVNLVDFDTLYGHRNDPAGYRDCLSAFDRRVPQILAAMREDDLLILTADHGNDPCYPGTDHTREQVPLLAFHRRCTTADLGTRASFADVAATIAENFGVGPLPVGTSFLGAL